MKKVILLIIYGLLFNFLIFFPQEVIKASKDGLILWYDSLVPILLPFLILSQFFLKTSMAEKLSESVGTIFKKIFHCSQKGVFCLLCGLLCGYPVGAKMISVLVKEKDLTKKEGQYLLSVCNNISPAFCITYGIRKAIGSNELLPYLIFIYGSPILFAFITRPKQMPEDIKVKQKQTSLTGNIFQLIDVCIIDSFSVLLKLCGYLVIFSIFSQGISLILPERPSALLPALTAVLEITNGLDLLGRLPSGILRSALCTAALTFGGLCAVFQTYSVIGNSGLSVKKYLFQKIGITFLSLCCFFLWLLLR